MWPRSRTRISLLALLLAIPVATAATLPSDPPLPGQPETPALPPLGGPGPIAVQEHGLTFLGPAHDPDVVTVQAPDGSYLLEYRSDADGRSRLDIAGTNVLADATLVAVEGAPTGDGFTLILRDADGKRHATYIDRAALVANLDLPPEAQVPAVELVRPPAWPGAPSAPFFLHVADSFPNILARSELDGTRFLQRGGFHRAAVQMPTQEADYDRIALQVTRVADNASLTATFAYAHTAGDAAIFRAHYQPSLLGLQEGDTVMVQAFYERKITPLVVERFPEPGTLRYRVDGLAPTVSIAAPAESDDFTFTVSWAGRDALSGVGSFLVDHREAGATQWIRWLERTPATSASFSGAWGKTYEFRAYALDAVGNPSQASTTVTTRVKAQPGGVDDVNDPPTARLITPRAGSLVAGVASITWSAEDPDGTPVTSKLDLSTDEGITWRSLYVGTGTSATWDTTREEDGAGYRLRLTVSDGTLQAFDAVSALTVRNLVATAAAAPPPSQSPGSPAAPTAAPETTQPAATQAGDEGVAPPEPEATRGVPAPFVGVAIVAAALLARRRS